MGLTLSLTLALGPNSCSKRPIRYHPATGGRNPTPILTLIQVGELSIVFEGEEAIDAGGVSNEM